jgi:hypothetical protein
MVYTIKKLEFKKIEWRLGCKTCIVYTGLYILVEFNANYITLHNNYACCAKMVGKEETPKCRKKTVTWTNEMIEDLIDFIEIHPIVAFEAIYEPMQVCAYTMQEILMNTHKFWWEIQQTKCHFWEKRRVLPFVLHYYVQLYCEIMNSTDKQT